MQYQYQMPKTLLMHIVDTSTNSSKYLENSKSQMQRRYDDSCGPTGQWIIIYVAQISNDDSCGRARCHQLYFCHWQSALCHAATLLGGTYFSVKIPQLAAHLALGKSPLFDCVCLSKPNPPAGEDLRDSHQHFDRPPPPPLPTKHILTFAVSWEEKKTFSMIWIFKASFKASSNFHHKSNSRIPNQVSMSNCQCQCHLLIFTI